ncbi:MAG: serine/threonine protein kinase [Planctomycetaceae bacterium]|jgi:serine/threonine protein kinase|nr:serine/threonine protein kinase [Planctomycetaceae bacterium]
MPVIDPNVTTCFDVERPQKTATFSAGRLLVGEFMLKEMLGRGGMGEVWKAYDRIAERDVVLKFVPQGVQHIKESMDAVRDSFKKVHELQHQHICPVYSLNNDPEHGLYIVMKYIDGLPLSDYRQLMVKQEGRMPFNDTVQILWGVSRALDYAHSKKVLHRDIKPHNIMLGKRDGVQIIDFGLAEEIGTSMVQADETFAVMGTRPYMSPEQWRGHYQDARTDQYSLAVTAYEMLAGYCPFVCKDIAILKNAVLNDAPEPIPDVPDYVNAAVLKAMSKERKDRFVNCKEFVRVLSQGEKPVRRATDRRFHLSSSVVVPKIDISSERDRDNSAVSTWKPKPFPVPKRFPLSRLFGRRPPDETRNIASDTSKPAIKIEIPRKADTTVSNISPPEQIPVRCVSSSVILPGKTTNVLLLGQEVPAVNVAVRKAAGQNHRPLPEWLFPAILAVVLFFVITLLMVILPPEKPQPLERTTGKAQIDSREILKNPKQKEKK